MNWEVFWDITGRASDILGIISVIISAGLWISFGRFKREIERQKIKYVEKQEEILKNLEAIYDSIFVDSDNIINDAIKSELRQQIYSIIRNFKRLLSRKNFKIVENLRKTTEINANEIDLETLRQNLDFIITIFTERRYDDE